MMVGTGCYKPPAGETIMEDVQFDEKGRLLNPNQHCTPPAGPAAAVRAMSSSGRRAPGSPDSGPTPGVGRPAADGTASPRI